MKQKVNEIFVHEGVVIVVVFVVAPLLLNDMAYTKGEKMKEWMKE